MVVALLSSIVVAVSDIIQNRGKRILPIVVNNFSAFLFLLFLPQGFFI